MLLLPFSAALAMLGGPSKPEEAERPIAYQQFKFGHKLYHMIKANLDSPTLATETVHANSLQGAWKLIAKKEPIAAITGTFFAPRQQRPVADVLVDGKLKATGSRGTAIGVDYNGGVTIFDQAFGQKTDWLDYQFGLRGTVRIIKDGKVRPNPQWQRFNDSRIWGRAARTAVGLTKSGKLVFVATRAKVTLSQLGKAMRSRGVMNAVSLDGGSSTCLYYNGSMIISPGRRLCNLVVISKRAVSSSSEQRVVRVAAARRP